jgi:hypothetical protein
MLNYTIHYVVHPINSWADRLGSFDLVTETGGMAHFGYYDGEYTCVVFERNLNEYSYDEACQGRSTIKTWDTAPHPEEVLRYALETLNPSVPYEAWEYDRNWIFTPTKTNI